jgi:hypothetical protein
MPARARHRPRRQGRRTSCSRAPRSPATWPSARARVTGRWHPQADAGVAGGLTFLLAGRSWPTGRRGCLPSTGRSRSTVEWSVHVHPHLHRVVALDPWGRPANEALQKTGIPHHPAAPPWHGTRRRITSGCHGGWLGGAAAQDPFAVRPHGSRAPAVSMRLSFAVYDGRPRA